LAAKVTEMIIVLISWRIKPRAVQEFRDWWRDQTVSQGLSGLFGEFLTEPVSASELRYKSNDMRPANGEYLPFVNVELWRDEDTFYAAVGQLFRDDQPLLDFEAKPRERTVLRQCESHRGDWVLPVYPVSESGTD
jgi:hypothetical protein